VLLKKAAMSDQKEFFALSGSVAERVLKKIKRIHFKILSEDELREEASRLTRKILFVDRDFLKNEALCTRIEQFPEIALVLIAEKRELPSVLAESKLHFLEIICAEEGEEAISQLVQRVEQEDGELVASALFRVVREFQQLGIITSSMVMAEIFLQVKKIALSNSTVLLIGESGTGKELIARSIHHFSKRRDFNFVAVNTGAIPENLLEDELFGHVRGAFTSALKDRKGKFEHAHRGTIFLDEISTMSPALQVKLLRVLQEREFERVGDNQPIKVDVRVISATNQDLEKLVRENAFRQDLFYRLNVIPIHIPPLRQRKKDIPLLANFFIKKYCQLNALPFKSLTMSALRALQDYSWPGNVRQLENMIERAVVLNPDKELLGVSDLSPEIFQSESSKENELVNISNLEIPDEGIALNEVLQKIERQLILRSLEKSSYNKQKAAQLLKIKRTTLIEKMKKIGT